MNAVAVVPSLAVALSLVGMAGCLASGPRDRGVRNDGRASTGELIWESTLVDQPPAIDGAVDSLWQRAAPLKVPVREAIGGGQERIVTLRALHTTESFYVLAQWDDPTRSDMRDPYVWNKEKGEYERPTRPDDQFALEFRLSGDFELNMLAMGREYVADVWHWKAGRGNPNGWVDDKRHIISANPTEGAQEYTFGKHGKVYIARPMDAGTPSYVAKPKPVERAGGVIDSFQPQEPVGSLADIRGKGVHDGRGWTLEMSRKFNTGHVDDAGLAANASIHCAVAILDDELYWNHSVSPLLRLEIKP